MTTLGNGLSDAEHHEDALPVQEAELAMKRRLGVPESSILVTQSNLAITYGELGRYEQSLQLERDVYSGRLKLLGEEHEETLLAANNYAISLHRLQRPKEASSVLRKMMPVAQRVLGESHETTLRIRLTYARGLYKDPAAALDDLRVVVTTLEETAPIARRVLGSSHPVVVHIEKNLGCARETLRAREAASSTVVLE